MKNGTLYAAQVPYRTGGAYPPGGLTEPVMESVITVDITSGKMGNEYDGRKFDEARTSCSGNCLPGITFAGQWVVANFNGQSQGTYSSVISDVVGFPAKP